MLRLTSRLFPILFILIAIVATCDLSASAQSSNQARYCRVTTGATQFRNWEQPLIQGNPNLSHFTWVPVTGYTQGRQRVIQHRGPDSKIVQEIPGARQRKIYMNPIAVSPNYIAAAPANPDVKGAVRVPTVMPARPASESDQGAVHGAIRVPLPAAADNDLSGKLAHKKSEQAVSAKLNRTTIASYPALSGSLYPSNGYNMLSGQGSSKSVHGMLKAAFRDK